MTNFDIPDYLLLLLRSYLSQRNQYVVVNGAKSDYFKATSSVPQGSIVGPVLFNLFINDICDFIKHSNILLYADDVKLFTTIHSLTDTDLLQEDIDNIVYWSELNKLYLNINKCAKMTYGSTKFFNKYCLQGSHIERLPIYKDLGVIMDGKLLFAEHIKEITKKASKSLSTIIRLSANFNVKTIVLLYNALVRPHLEYASIIWNPNNKSLSETIERVQKRLLRFLYFKKHRIYPHYHFHPVRTSAMEIEFNIQCLKSRRDVSEYIFLFKLLNHSIDCIDLMNNIGIKVSQRNTRSTGLLFVPKRRSSPLSRAIENFNKLNNDLDIFSRNLHNFMHIILQVTGLSHS